MTQESSPNLVNFGVYACVCVRVLHMYVRELILRVVP